MTRFAASSLALFFACCCAGQTPVVPAQIPSSEASLQALGHGAFPVVVTQTLDSSKLSKGDVVEAETGGSFKLPDGRLVPKGSKLTGHVTVATARSKGAAKSELGIIFDRVRVPNDGELKLETMVQAVYPPALEADPGVVNGYTMSKDGGPGYLPPDIKTGSNPDALVRIDVVVDLNSVGVQGLKNLELKRDGVLSSPGGQRVKLGRGMRLVVQVIVFG